VRPAADEALLNHLDEADPALLRPQFVEVRALAGRAGLGWAGLGWAGLGWAGLGWAGLGGVHAVLGYNGALCCVFA